MSAGDRSDTTSKPPPQDGGLAAPSTGGDHARRLWWWLVLTPVASLVLVALPRPSALRLPLALELVHAVGIASWTLLVCAALAIVHLGLGRVRPRAGERGAHLRWAHPRWALVAFAELLLIAGFVPVVASWLLRWRSGAFLTTEMLEFFLADARAVLTMLTRDERRGILAAVVGALVLHTVIRFVLRPARDQARWPRSTLLAALIGLLGVATTMFVVPSVALSPPLADRFAKVGCYQSTPGLALLCAWTASGPEAQALPAVQPIAPGPPVPPDAVDRARLRNVVLVVVEAWRRDTLAKLGADDAYMPWLDRRSDDALVFSRAYAQSNSTDYSVPSILASLYPFKRPRPARFSRLDYPRLLVYDVLAPLGYRSAIFSSGNERWVDTDWFLDSAQLDVFFHAGKYSGETILSPQDTGLWQNIEAGMLEKGSVDDAVTVGKLLEWVAQGPDDQPFFVYLNLQTTHFPYQQAFDMPTPFEPHELDFECSFASYSPEHLPVMRNRYANSLRYVDGQLERLVETIEDLPLAHDTLFIVVGDHGEEFLEHGGVTHAQEMHDVTLRVPLLILGRDADAPRRVDDRLIQHIDILPTVFGLMGLPQPKAWQGHDVLSDAHDPADHKLFLTTQNMRQQNVLIWRGYKLIIDRTGRNRLYAIERDPGETVDLIETHPEIAQMYTRILLDWMSVQLTFYGSRDYYLRYYPPRY